MIVWFQTHMELVAAILFALLSISEIMALTPSIQSNSIFQFVVSMLKKGYEAVKPKPPTT